MFAGTTVTSETRCRGMTSKSSISSWIVSAPFAKTSDLREPLERSHRRLRGWGIRHLECALLLWQRADKTVTSPRGEAGAGIEPANRGFADPDLTTWLPRPDCVPERRRAPRRCQRSGTAIQLSRNGRRQSIGMFLLAISGISHVGQRPSRLPPASLLSEARLRTELLLAAHNC
jgi:hypothetical protein